MCDEIIIVDEANKVLVALLVGVMVGVVVLIDGRIFKFGFTLTVGPRFCEDPIVIRGLVVGFSFAVIAVNVKTKQIMITNANRSKWNGFGICGEHLNGQIFVFFFVSV